MSEHIWHTGDVIAEPGAWKGVPLDIYHSAVATAGPSISSSGLRTIWSDSPAHYWCRSPYNPNRVEDKRSDALDLGAAAHHWLLGEPKFAERFLLSPYPDFRTKEAREWRDAQSAAGKVILSIEQWQSVQGMREGLLRNSLVREAGILDGHVERSIYWRGPDDLSWIWLRSRPDVIPTGSGQYTDLKTTTSVQRHDLSRTIANFGYRMQAALLRMGCRALGLPFEMFSLVFVEKEAPYCSRVVTLKDAEIDRGERQCKAALTMFADGLKTGEWPGPDGDQQDSEWIETPAWDQAQTDDRIEMLSRNRK
jgi:hypothetical protein